MEALVRNKHGANYLKDRQAKTEVVAINLELRRLKTQIAALEERKSKLIADLPDGERLRNAGVERGRGSAGGEAKAGKAKARK